MEKQLNLARDINLQGWSIGLKGLPVIQTVPFHLGREDNGHLMYRPFAGEDYDIKPLGGQQPHQKH